MQLLSNKNQGLIAAISLSIVSANTINQYGSTGITDAFRRHQIHKADVMKSRLYYALLLLLFCCHGVKMCLHFRCSIWFQCLEWHFGRHFWNLKDISEVKNERKFCLCSSAKELTFDPMMMSNVWCPNCPFSKHFVEFFQKRKIPLLIHYFE